MDLDIRLEKLKRDAQVNVRKCRKKFANGERVRLHLQFVIFGSRAQRGAQRRLTLRGRLFEIKGKLRLLRRLRRRPGLSFGDTDAFGFEVDNLNSGTIDQQLVDHAIKNAERSTQAKTPLTPQTVFA